MIEKIIKKYLDTVASVPVLLEKPPNPPINYFLIEKAGGGKENHICTATIIIQSYGETLLHAAQLNEDIKEMMEGIVELNCISSVKLNSDYNYTETGTKKYRYQAVFDVVHF